MMTMTPAAIHLPRLVVRCWETAVVAMRKVLLCGMRLHLSKNHQNLL
jgi:hypothetical protein